MLQPAPPVGSAPPIPMPVNSEPSTAPQQQQQPNTGIGGSSTSQEKQDGVIRQNGSLSQSSAKSIKMEQKSPSSVLKTASLSKIAKSLKAVKNTSSSGSLRSAEAQSSAIDLDVESSLPPILSSSGKDDNSKQSASAPAARVQASSEASKGNNFSNARLTWSSVTLSYFAKHLRKCWGCY